MKLKQIIFGIVLTSALLSPVYSQELTGDTKLACEAILCLSSGTRPSECAPSLARYFSISFRRFSDTLRGRTNFLNLCPSSNSPDIPPLINAIVSGAGFCEADVLNSRLERGNIGDGDPSYIDNTLPAECAAYNANPLVRLNLFYQGVPGDGGRWVTGI